MDACIGGFALPWWSGLPEWDFRLAGVTSISADLHKYGYAPKGVSVLLQRGRDRQRLQYFATYTLSRTKGTLGDEYRNPARSNRRQLVVNPSDGHWREAERRLVQHEQARP